ncbi:hypothetical protein GCM10027296_34600 [Chitinimonas naiadis]
MSIDPARDHLFNKSRPNCFQATDLAAQLAALACDTLVITGMKTQYCVDTTCRAAADLGLKVVLAADAHTCMDTPALSAAAIIAHHNATLNGSFATLVPTVEIHFQVLPVLER